MQIRLFLLAISLSACTSLESESRSQQSVGEACVTDADCPLKHVCVEDKLGGFTCELPPVDPPSTACKTDADCPPKFNCIDDNAGGFKCEPQSGETEPPIEVPPSCTTNADCPPKYTCVDDNAGGFKCEVVLPDPSETSCDPKVEVCN